MAPICKCSVFKIRQKYLGLFQFIFFFKNEIQYSKICMNFHYLDLDSHSFQMQRLLLLILPTSFSLLSLPRKPQTFPNSPLVSNDLTQTRTEEDPTQTRTDPPYTCDSILGSSLCPLEEEHKTLEVRGTTLHYWVYQVDDI